MKSNVVKMTQPIAVKQRESLVMAIDQLDSYHGRRKIASLLREWHLRLPRSEHTWEKFSQHTGLNPRTVSKIASEDTKSPRLHTILMIMRGLGFSAVRFDA